MDFIHTLAIESWTMYSVGILLVACRIYSRHLQLGSWKLGVDDWLMIFATANFTGVMVSVNEVAVNGSSYMDPEVAAGLTKEQHDAAVYGSKMTLVLEVFTLNCIWSVKACLLILYYRLTNTLRKQQLAVLFIAGFCAIAYILVMSLLLGYWCAPIYEYWAVPYNQSECATYYHHMMFATAWNISSDLMLLAIPFPIVFKTQLPLKKKIGLCCVLGLGALNIIVAILNRYFNFSNPNDLGYVYFYVAEVATAIYVGNIPLCWALIQRVFSAGPWSRSATASGGLTSAGGSRGNRLRSTLKKSGDVFSRATASKGGVISTTSHADPTPWSKSASKSDSDDFDLEGQSQRSKDYVCPENVNDATNSTVELTRPWGGEDGGVQTTVHASRPHNPDTAAGQNGTFWLGDQEQGKGNIVKTVQISTVYR
ncbi:hypothetical protein B0T25DRAFT_578413 [Lasiosphaeria hispida]|uniref:Rhodopsin domain-containing protein n=1 Tax=Lasiosphaeria hispida TaxID=260671 RepID=A0AAJ0HS88_9PEZI|nr:hypothetical protein B0T25DRAFT_578413 [Lasiosphaeria hispida]